MEVEIKNFYDLHAWQSGHALALEIYKITNSFPKEELYGITNQLRRASSSITANIAEGFARYHFNDKIRFYYHSRGSAAEVLNFLLLARDLGYINVQIFDKMKIDLENIMQLINGMIRSIEKQQS